MFDFEKTLSGIEYKIRQLAEENELLREKVLEHEEREEKYKETIKNQELEIDNLKEEIKIIKLRNTIAQKGDSVETKLKINQLIRTIDKSIELLNKSE